MNCSPVWRHFSKLELSTQTLKRQYFSERLSYCENNFFLVFIKPLQRFSETPTDQEDAVQRYSQ